MNAILLPYMSAILLQNIGPMDKPKTGTATVQLTSAYDIEYSSWKGGKDGTVAVVRNVKRKLPFITRQLFELPLRRVFTYINITIPNKVHFCHLGKFKGSSGSEVGFGFSSVPSIPAEYSATYPKSLDNTLVRAYVMRVVGDAEKGYSYGV
ncbi:hypothetical protein BDZ91DRAFT_205042 [Kalaharituber pfeilii]|nr:hypothetical protein BDZ91DRAFT_205042 [Kalaharituber pfeilii]